MGGHGFDFREPGGNLERSARALRRRARHELRAARRGGLQWPCPARTTRDRSLHRGRFAIGPRAALHLAEYEPTPERRRRSFPFLLTTGRTLYQFNAATMTGRTRNEELRPTDLLDLSPADAHRSAHRRRPRAHRQPLRRGNASGARDGGRCRPDSCTPLFSSPNLLLNAGHGSAPRYGDGHAGIQGHSRPSRGGSLRSVACRRTGSCDRRRRRRGGDSHAEHPRPHQSTRHYTRQSVCRLLTSPRSPPGPPRLTPTRRTFTGY